MPTLNITEERINNALKTFQTYGAGLGERNQVTVVYPGGSYVNDLITFTNKDNATLEVMTSLAVVAPGVTLNLLSQKGFIVPALNPVDTALVIPGVNDFTIVSPPASRPTPAVMNFIGPEIIVGSGRYSCIYSPLDHFVNGGICFQDGKYYRKSIVVWPFGNMIEWDEVTVVGV